MSAAEPAEIRECQPAGADAAGPNWDDLGCLAIFTLFGWLSIAACIHDWFFSGRRLSWFDLFPLCFCVYANAATTVLWVRYARWRCLPPAARLNISPFPQLRQLTPEEAALIEEQLSGERDEG